VSDALATAPAGAKTFGKYILTDRIGKGGMAEIFRAKVQGASGFEKEVVIKRMLPALCDDPGFTHMMVREAKILVTLRHQNIVQVYELGEVDGRYYIAMEYIHGRDLRAVLARCVEKNRAFPVGLASLVVLEVLRALEYAYRVPHKDGRPLELVHRDVSPTNLMVSFEGEVKVLDFGIAKVDVGDFVTREGLIKGNCPYMSPEQVAGSDLDQRSDLFSLGSTFYEMLTGKRAFEAPSYIAVMQRIWADEPTPIRELRADIPGPLANVVHKLLQKEKPKRWSSAAEVHKALADLVAKKEIPIGTPFELGAFMRELYGDDSLTERRSIPDEDRPRMETVRADDTRPGTDALPARHDGGTVPLLQPDVLRSSLTPAPERVSRGTAALRKLVPGGRPHWTVIAVASALVGAVVVAAFGGLRERERTPRAISHRDEQSQGTRQGPTELPVTTAPEAVVVGPDPERPQPVKTVPLGTGYLRLNTTAGGEMVWANVWIDNVRVDKPTPLVDVPVPAGPHLVKVHNPAYPAQTVTVRIRRGARLTRVVELLPAGAAPATAAP
jgi:serine/threonine protein kinase